MIPRQMKLAASVACLLLAAGCAGNATTSAGSGGNGGPIVIGASMSLSGQINLASIQAGYQMKVNEVNQAGGLDVAGVKRKIKLKVLDNRGDTSTMIQQVRQLVLSDGAVALLGSCCQQNIDMTAQADALKVPLSEVALPVELAPKSSYSWDAFESLTDQAHQFFSLAGTVGTNKKVIFITDNDGQSTYTSKLWSSVGKQAGYHIVAADAVPSGTTNYSNLITSAKSAGAQILVTAMVPGDCFALWKQMKAFGYVPKLAIGLQCAQTPGWGSLGALGNGALVALNWTKTAGLPHTSQILADYGTRFPALNDLGSVAAGYQAADIVLTAITKAGSVRPQAINTAMGTVSVTSAEGPVAFGGGHTYKTPSYLGQWENGSIVQVWPRQGAGAAGSATEIGVQPCAWTMWPSRGVTVQSVLFGICSAAVPKYHGLHSRSERYPWVAPSAWLTLALVIGPLIDSIRSVAILASRKPIWP